MAKTPSSKKEIAKQDLSKLSDAELSSLLAELLSHRDTMTYNDVILYANYHQEFERRERLGNTQSNDEPTYETQEDEIEKRNELANNPYQNKLTFDINDLPATGAEDSGEVYQGHSILSKQLTRSCDSKIFLGRNNTLPVGLRMLDHNSEVLDTPLTQYESAVQQALYSLLDDGFLCVTGAQIYRKMKGNKKSNPAQEQKGIKDIDMAMKKLQAITVEISLSKEETKVKSLGEIIKLDEAQKQTSMLDALASFIEQKTEVRGNMAIAYVMKPILDPETKTYDPRPLIQRIEVALKQFEKIPDELLAVTKLSPKGLEKEIYLNKERIAIRHYITDFLMMVRRVGAKQKYSNKRSYQDIFKQCELTKEQRSNAVRYKSFIHDCLDFYKRKGVISDWQEYYVKHNKRAQGIEVFA